MRSGTLERVKFAPRLSPRLVDEIERLACERLTAAEISRLVGAKAERLGLPRPSYQRVRVLVREHRERRRPQSTADALLDVTPRVRPPVALLGEPQYMRGARRRR
jgi:hypothetical protein